MQKIRINDLARELEVKSKAILDVLEKVGVTEKKTHSSSIEVDEAERVRQYFAREAEAAPRARESRPTRVEDEIKTKIDLSKISRPGDVLKAIHQQASPQPAAPPRPAAAAPPVVRAASTAVPPVRPAAPPPAAMRPAPAVAPPAPPPQPPTAVTPESPARSAPAAPVSAAP